MAGMGWGRGDW